MSDSLLLIPGFFPDPSICRVGGDLFMVHSSFEYLPGVPLFHGASVGQWTQIGNVLAQPSQMPSADTGRGIFAPTIRHNAGRFFVTTTDVGRIGSGQLIVSTDDPFGEWSDPVFVPGTGGIDPDLAWDDDGQAYLTWTTFGASGSAIRQAPIDLGAGRLLSQPVTLRTGRAQHTEGPHLYRRGDWWYLLTADGGTERGHMVCVSRGRTISGPFEEAPQPILTHRSTNGMLQNTGHADLVELADGSWAMVHLGVRVRGTTPSFHVNGRETFITAIEWADDWPVVVPLPEPVLPVETTVDELFDGELGPEWISPGAWAQQFAKVGGGLHLEAAQFRPRFIGIRARDLEWDLTVTVSEGCPTVAVRVDDDHILRVRVEPREIVAELNLIGAVATLGRQPRSSEGLVVEIASRTLSESAMDQTGPDELRVSVIENGVRVELGRIDGRYLSTEVAGGFTGRILGVEEGAAAARVARVEYRPFIGLGS